jgi:hypothetical protein
MKKPGLKIASELLMPTIKRRYFTIASGDP